MNGFSTGNFFRIFCNQKSALENFSNFSKKINIQTTDRSVQNFWGLGCSLFHRFQLGNQQFKFFSMNSASMNSALETFFEIFVMKSALENFSNFSKKINVQTTDRSVQNFWGLGFGMFAISPISAKHIIVRKK